MTHFPSSPFDHFDDRYRPPMPHEERQVANALNLASSLPDGMDFGRRLADPLDEHGPEQKQLDYR
jgi:hypothetical protein